MRQHHILGSKAPEATDHLEPDPAMRTVNAFEEKDIRAAHSINSLIMAIWGDGAKQRGLTMWGPAKARGRASQQG